MASKIAVFTVSDASHLVKIIENTVTVSLRKTLAVGSRLHLL
jgi:hypothetical protein